MKRAYITSQNPKSKPCTSTASARIPMLSPTYYSYNFVDFRSINAKPLKIDNGVSKNYDRLMIARTGVTHSLHPQRTPAQS